MIYDQNGNPNLSYIHQTLNTFYYATGYPCTYMPFNQEYTYNNQIGLPTSFSPNSSIEFILKNVDYTLSDCQTWHKNMHAYLSITLYHKKLYHGILLVDISQAHPLQHASLKSMFALCVKSSPFIVNAKPTPQMPAKTEPLIIATQKSEKVQITNMFKGHNEIKHHPYHLEQKQMQHMLLTGEFTNDITNDYVMPLLGLDELRSTKNHTIISISLLARTAINLGLDAHSAFSISDYFILEVEKANTLKDLDEIANNTLDEYHRYISEKKDSRPPIVEAMVRFIDNHLNEKLSLEAFAATTDYTYTYLSGLFKRTIGMNFTEYASVKKIEKSCTLLKDRNASIQMISDQCGYSYSYQYIKAFKKIMGVTPGVYKKIIQTQ